LMGFSPDDKPTTRVNMDAQADDRKDRRRGWGAKQTKRVNMDSPATIVKTGSGWGVTFAIMAGKKMWPLIQLLSACHG